MIAGQGENHQVRHFVLAAHGLEIRDEKICPLLVALKQRPAEHPWMYVLAQMAKPGTGAHSIRMAAGGAICPEVLPVVNFRRKRRKASVAEFTVVSQSTVLLER